MLRELRIRNFAVVENVTVPFAPGLNVLTGETGAGKSILVDAIHLVRGARAQTDVIRADAESATVEAVFAVPDGGVAAALDEAGLTVEEGEIVVRRELSRSGRHRAFVNDAAVTVGLLERLGDALVQVHGQHEHQRLLEPVRQLDLLDRFADAAPLCARCATRSCSSPDGWRRSTTGWMRSSGWRANTATARRRCSASAPRRRPSWTGWSGTRSCWARTSGGSPSSRSR